MTSPAGVGADGRVVALHVAPAHGEAVRAVDSVEVGPAGIVGDRFEGSRHRHVTVQAADRLAAASADLGARVEPGATRRNVTVDGLEVPWEPGSRIVLGPVLLEVVRVAAPCRVLEESVGPGARAALRRRAGSVCRVVVPGRVAVGDAAGLRAPG